MFKPLPVKLNLPMKGGLGSCLVSNEVVVLVNETLNQACVIVVIILAEDKAFWPLFAIPSRSE